MARTIILGYDGSESAKAALDVAIDLAGEPESKIWVVHGHSLRLGSGGRQGADLYGEARDGVMLQVQDEMQPILKEAVDKVAAAGVAVESVLVWESGAKAMLDVAAREKGTILVVGHHGEGAFEGLLLGSVAFRLVHKSHLPVVVVPHHE